MRDLPAGTFTFYREKVDLGQTHTLTRDSLRALVAYPDDRRAAGDRPVAAREPQGRDI